MLSLIAWLALVWFALAALVLAWWLRLHGVKIVRRRPSSKPEPRPVEPEIAAALRLSRSRTAEVDAQVEELEALYNGLGRREQKQ